MKGKKTLILGASVNPMRYSYLAAKRLLKYEHPIELIGRDEGEIDGNTIKHEATQLNDIDTVTMYLNANNQKQYYDYIINLHPKRIIFNPGAENPELAALALKNNIEPIEACTLVMLGTNQY